MYWYEAWLRWGCSHNTAKWNKWEQELEKKGWEHTEDGAWPMRLTIRAESAEGVTLRVQSDLNGLRGLALIERCPMCNEVDFYLTIE